MYLSRHQNTVNNFYDIYGPSNFEAKIYDYDSEYKKVEKIIGFVVPKAELFMGVLDYKTEEMFVSFKSKDKSKRIFSLSDFVSKVIFPSTEVFDILYSIQSSNIIKSDELFNVLQANKNLYLASNVINFCFSRISNEMKLAIGETSPANPREKSDYEKTIKENGLSKSHAISAIRKTSILSSVVKDEKIGDTFKYEDIISNILEDKISIDELKDKFTSLSSDFRLDFLSEKKKFKNHVDFEKTNRFVVGVYRSNLDFSPITYPSQTLSNFDEKQIKIIEGRKEICSTCPENKGFSLFTVNCNACGCSNLSLLNGKCKLNKWK